VLLRISDDGSGFDPTQVGRGHLGLVGMQQRADRLGADLIVDSRPDAGTTVEVRLPVGAAAEREPAVASAE
jgi:signal transduction histidine kinase